MTVFADAIDAIYADDNMAVDASYTPAATGAAVDVRLLRREPGEAEMQYQSKRFATGSGGGHLWSVRAAEVTPVAGDSFVVDDTTYEVQGTPEAVGSDRLEWTFEAREGAS